LARDIEPRIVVDTCGIGVDPLSGCVKQLVGFINGRWAIDECAGRLTGHGRRVFAVSIQDYFFPVLVGCQNSAGLPSVDNENERVGATTCPATTSKKSQQLRCSRFRAPTERHRVAVCN